MKVPFTLSPIKKAIILSFLASRDKIERFYYDLCRREVAEWMIDMKKRLLSVLFVVTMLSMSCAAVYAADDYPSKYRNAALDAVVDEWNFYNRECTSFVAWCLNNRNGVGFRNWYGGVHWGNAKNWGSAAGSLGISINGTPVSLNRSASAKIVMTIAMMFLLS